MTRKVTFFEFEEARISAGLFFDATLEELDISERTYYRWKSVGFVPWWAFRIVELHCKSLARYGWDRWEIDKGRLYHLDLNPRYYYWEPGKLLAQRLIGVNRERAPVYQMPTRNTDNSKLAG